MLEISNIIKSGSLHQRPLTQPKNKIYDNDIEIDKSKTLTDYINQLNNINRTLWDLEDRRRDLTFPDPERLEAADSISVHNKMRNDLIDAIDSKIEHYIRSR